MWGGRGEEEGGGEGRGGGGEGGGGGGEGRGGGRAISVLGLFTAGAMYDVHTQSSTSVHCLIHKYLHSQTTAPDATNATNATSTSSCQRYNFTKGNGTPTVEMYPPRICHAKSTGVRCSRDWTSACALLDTHVSICTISEAVVVTGRGVTKVSETLFEAYAKRLC